jgi:hypothetical protein
MRHTLLADHRTEGLDDRLDNLRTSARVHLYILLGRIAYEGRRERLPGLSVQAQLTVIVTAGMFDLYLRIRAPDLDLVVTLLHMR